MLFNSWIFVALVVSTMLIYYTPFIRKWQTYVLLVASFLFYAYDSMPLLMLLLLSAVINAVASYGAFYLKHPRIYATSGVILNVTILAIFKYGELLSSSFFDVNSGVGHFLTTIPLPLGISFYTFSGISLVVDAYRGHLDNDTQLVPMSFSKHLKKTLLYICFFPKLLAGPIAKSKDFFAEMGYKSFQCINWQFAFKSLVMGYFLKMVIADNLQDFTFWMAYPFFNVRGTGTLLLCVLGYSLQIFADFAGYSLIAIGVASLFGYRLPTNFHFPYISSSFREFWKRWHITLSQFLMEYLYFSLGGNRKGKVRTYINLLLTMMLGGLWHGAGWSYLVWGTFHGLCLAIERAVCGKRVDCIQLGQGRLLTKLSHFLSIAFVFILVSFGWLLFMLPDFEQAALFIKCIVTNYDREPFIDPKILPVLVYAIPIALYHLIYYNREMVWIKRYVLRFDFVFYGIMLFLILTNSGSAGAFVYFQF